MTKQKSKVLFICTANSARSQMAEALLKSTAGDNFEVASAGTSPTVVHPKTIEALKKYNIDTEELRAKDLSEFINQEFDYVISLCDRARNECRAFQGTGRKLEWSFEDPLQRAGANPFEVTLNEINQRINMFVTVETARQTNAIEIDPISFFKNLTDEIRLYCLMLIQYEGELCVCEMVEALHEIQPKISRHLALMKKSGLLVDRRQGQWMFYRINPDLPAWAKSVISETTENNVALIESKLRNLSEMKDRPQRQSLPC